MQIEPIAYFRSPLTSKFGIPRQAGLAPSLSGMILFQPAYRHAEAVRGLETFSHLWLIWEFSDVRRREGVSLSLTVRPPRLGGNERVGVFASRSPFRPNGLGLSCVKIEKIVLDNHNEPAIRVSGADLMDGTPIYDIKPYVSYADSHPDARCGFVDNVPWTLLQVVIPDTIANKYTEEQLQGLRQVLSLDPRPHYHHNPNRIYGMPYEGHDIHFRVDGLTVYVVE